MKKMTRERTRRMGIYCRGGELTVRFKMEEEVISQTCKLADGENYNRVYI